MKESISYTFVLNIVIMFIFICAAVIMGIFSYFRAYKANTIIINEIEKYEGYNCLSAQTIAQKLSTISYNVPFDAKCKSSYDKPCMTDDNKNYAVVSYNLDHNEGDYLKINEMDNNQKKYNEMNSQYKCDDKMCENTKKYQYGVYTYMYVDVPIVSNMIRIPVYTKSSVMYEHRNIMIASTIDNPKAPYDIRNIPNNFIYDNFETQKNRNNIDFRGQIQSVYASKQTGDQGVILDIEHNTRLFVQYDANGDGAYDPSDTTIVGNAYDNLECGIIRDYSKY